MKHPIPSPPQDAPPGTVALGGPLGWFSAAFHVTADGLDPAQVTLLFRIEPTSSLTKGVPILRADGTIKRIPKFGRWETAVKAAQTDEWDINEVVNELLTRLPADKDTWDKVAQLGRLQISLGLELHGSNGDFALDADLLRFLGERQVTIYFDVYRHDEGQP